MDLIVFYAFFMEMKFDWRCLAFTALLGLWSVGCQTADSGQANTDTSQPDAKKETMNQAKPPSAEEIIAAEASLAAENHHAVRSETQPSEKKVAAEQSEMAKKETATETTVSSDKKQGNALPAASKEVAAETTSLPAETKTEAKTSPQPEPLKQETATETTALPEKKQAEAQPAEGKETAAENTAAPATSKETKTEVQPEPKSVENKTPDAQPKPVKTENTEATHAIAAEPKAEEVTPIAAKAPAESPFTGTVVLLPPQKKFVIVDFRSGDIPPVRSELGVYREGIFVGSVRISEPVKPPLASADVLTGALQRGDVVR